MNVVNKKLKKDITDLHIINTTETILKSINKNLVDIHKFKFLTDIIKSDLSPQIISDIVREKLANKSIALFGIKSNNKNFILCTITKDFGDSISAGDFIKKIVNQLGLKGGGSKFMALVSIDQIKQFNEGLEIGKKIINEGLNNYVQ